MDSFNFQLAFQKGARIKWRHCFRRKWIWVGKFVLARAVSEQEVGLQLDDEATNQ